MDTLVFTSLEGRRAGGDGDDDDDAARLAPVHLTTPDGSVRACVGRSFCLCLCSLVSVCACVRAHAPLCLSASCARLRVLLTVPLQVMLGSRVTELVGTRVLADARSLYGRRPGEGGAVGDGAAGADAEREAVLVIHGPSTHPDAVRVRRALGRLLLFALAADCLLMGYDAWTRPLTALHTVAFTLVTVRAAVGGWATLRQQLLVLALVQVAVAVQFVVGLTMVVAPVHIARLLLLVALYVALDAYRDRCGHRWFIPFL
jgi:hypothetical protein